MTTELNDTNTIEEVLRWAVLWNDDATKAELKRRAGDGSEIQDTSVATLVDAVVHEGNVECEQAFAVVSALLVDPSFLQRHSLVVVAIALAVSTLQQLERWDEATEVIRRFRDSGPDLDEMEEIALRHREGVSQLNLRNFREAFVELTQAQTLVQQTGPEILKARIDIDLANVSISSGDLVKAITFLQRGLLILGRLPGQQRETVRARVNLASAYISAGYLDDALKEYTQLVQEEAITALPALHIPCTLNLAITLKRLQKHEESLAAYTETLRLSEENRHIMFQVRSLIGITDLYVKTEQLEKASDAIDDAKSRAVNHNITALLPEIHAHEANIAHERGLVEEAISLLDDAYRKVIATEDITSAILYGVDLADWLAARGDFKKAYAVQQECSAFQRQINESELERSLALNKVRSEFEQERELIKSRDEERNRVLHSVMPPQIAQRLMSGERRIADRIPDASILFADMVGFTSMASGIDADELVVFLEELFTAMDAISHKHGCQRVKTIGDAYMAIAEGDHEHTERIVRAAEEMAASNTGPFANVKLRIGVNSGPIVAGVMRGARMSYDVWGDTVNVAARMEELSKPGYILCTETVAKRVRNMPDYALEEREPLDIRGKGLMTTYWIQRRSD